MPTLRLDALAIAEMASGHKCLNLTEQMSWEGFPDYADTLLSEISGSVVKRWDSFDVRLWEVRIGGLTVLRLGGVDIKLVFDDFPVMVSLESDSSAGDRLIERLYATLSGIPKHTS